MLTVITGPMFAGKTSAMFALQPGQIFKPSVDTRSPCVTTHDGQSRLAWVIDTDSPESLLDMARAPVIGIDEAQFFGPGIVPTVRNLLQRHHVVVSGLDLDAQGWTFGAMGCLMALATEVRKLTATCARCGQPACRTYRTAREQGLVVIGGADKYQARCLPCWRAG